MPAYSMTLVATIVGNLFVDAAGNVYGGAVAYQGDANVVFEADPATRAVTACGSATAWWRSSA